MKQVEPVEPEAGPAREVTQGFVEVEEFAREEVTLFSDLKKEQIARQPAVVKAD